MVEIRNRHRSAHGRNLRHDVIQLVVECGALMNKINACRMGNFFEIKTVAASAALVSTFAPLDCQADQRLMSQGRPPGQRKLLRE